MNSAKYVMIDGIKPIIFNGLSHDAFKALGDITSAGFVKLYIQEGGHIESAPSVEVVVHGESFSLKLKPNPVDAELIKTALGYGGKI